MFSYRLSDVRVLRTGLSLGTSSGFSLGFTRIMFSCRLSDVRVLLVASAAKILKKFSALVNLQRKIL